MLIVESINMFIKITGDKIHGQIFLLITYYGTMILISENSSQNASYFTDVEVISSLPVIFATKLTAYAYWPQLIHDSNLCLNSMLPAIHGWLMSFIRLTFLCDLSFAIASFCLQQQNRLLLDHFMLLDSTQSLN